MMLVRVGIAVCSGMHEQALLRYGALRKHSTRKHTITSYGSRPTTPTARKKEPTSAKRKGGCAAPRQTLQAAVTYLGAIRARAKHELGAKRTARWQTHSHHQALFRAASRCLSAVTGPSTSPLHGDQGHRWRQSGTSCLEQHGLAAAKPSAQPTSITLQTRKKRARHIKGVCSISMARS